MPVIFFIRIRFENMYTKLLYGLAGYIVQQGLGLRKIKWIKIKN